MQIARFLLWEAAKNLIAPLGQLQIILARHKTCTENQPSRLSADGPGSQLAEAFVPGLIDICYILNRHRTAAR